MDDEKNKTVTDATVPDAGPVPAQPESGGGTPAMKQEQTAPETEAPEAKVPEQAAPAQPNKGSDAPKEQKAASVSVFNFSEIMAEKKAAERATAKEAGKSPDKKAPAPAKEAGLKQEEQAQPPKRRGRPPKADKDKAATPTQKEAPARKDKAAQKPGQTKNKDFVRFR